MRRAVGAAVVVGLANGLVAALVVHVVWSTRKGDVGWFAYAPLQEAVPSSRLSFSLVVLLIVSLVALNVALAVLAVRRRWLATTDPVLPVAAQPDVVASRPST